MRSFGFIVCFGLIAACGNSAWSDDHDHPGGSNAKTAVQAPTVFLDKSPRIVEYQLRRLDNLRLLMVPRKTNDAKYVPVYQAILSRPGISPQHRIEATEALVTLQSSDPISVLLSAIQTTDKNSGKHDDRSVRRTIGELSTMVLRQPKDVMTKHLAILQEATKDEIAAVAAAGFAGLIVTGQASDAVERSASSTEMRLAWLESIALVPKPEMRSSLLDAIFQALESSDDAKIRQAAVSALASIEDHQESIFEKVAPLVRDTAVRDTAIRTLLAIAPENIAPENQDAESSQSLLSDLVAQAEQTPAGERTSQAFTDAMQLADRLMTTVSTDQAKEFRQRLREITVRLIRIKTVEEEMRYDLPYFAVQAGSKIQVVLENDDLMPHNWVLTTPGSLKEVAQLGLEAGPNQGSQGLPYVPESEAVLHATPMIEAHQQARLTFTAPSEPGEYPYVCTFPQHWYRMYGVMVVVDDLDAWLQNPVEPANPIGSNRTFVQAWTTDDFDGQIDSGLVGRSPEIGKRIFVEASCAGCHKVGDEGGVIGPDLTDVISRWKGDRMGVMREILEPSHKIDPKYAMQRVLTVDGRTLSGVLVAEDDDNITLMSNPEAKEPMIVAQDDIEAMVPSSVSMMPKALMDQYTKDEIFELMGYLESVNSMPSPSSN